MKPKITPTQHEIVLTEQDVIVTKTDLKGRIRYANRAFMRIADYAEDDLLDQQHNIVRHPDMPRGAFRLLWNTLEAGQEFYGYVKNMSSRGDYYWVFANVTLDRDAQGNVVGYFSVRRKANKDALAVMEPLYREMLAVESRAGAAKAPDASIAFLQDKLNEMGVSYHRFILSLYKE